MRKAVIMIIAILGSVTIGKITLAGGAGGSAAKRLREHPWNDNLLGGGGGGAFFWNMFQSAREDPAPWIAMKI